MSSLREASRAQELTLAFPSQRAARGDTQGDDQSAAHVGDPAASIVIESLGHVAMCRKPNG